MSSSRSPWSVTALMAVGAFTSMFALSTLIEGAAWMRTVALILLVAAGTSIGVRALSRSRFLPTLAALAATVVVMIPLFAVSEEGARHLLPTPSAIGDLWQALVDGAIYAAETAAPAEPAQQLVALLAAFAAAIFIVADHLAASWRAVAVSGIVLMLPWTPAIFLQYQVPLWALFATAACWMLAMALARSPIVTHRSAPITGAALATTAALVATFVVAPAALGGNGWGMIPRFNAPSALDTSTRLNLALDLRNSLTVNSEQTVMSYVSTGDNPDAFRIYTLREFDGTTWARENDAPDDLESASGGVLWPESVPGWNDAEHVILDIDITAASERNLPLPTVPRSVDVDESWQYSPSRDEVSTEGRGTQGLSFSTVAVLDYFTAEALKASPETPAPSSPSISAVYTEVPTSVDIERISGLAREITKGTDGQYEEAVAIQNYLRNASAFTYDTSVAPADGADAVSSFLDEKRGYCVHFATTMVMLSRSLGIPARMAIGYLGGHQQEGGTFEVRGGDAHAWPELYFPGQGWVRFEPTPAVQTGNAPAYTISAHDGNPQIPTAVPETTSIPSSGPRPTGLNPTAQPVDSTAGGGVSWLVLAVAALLAVGAGFGIWALRRRSAAHAAAHGPEAAWESLRTQVPETMRWTSSLTPIEAAESLTRAMASASAPLTDEAAKALAELRDAVSDLRYAPPKDADTNPDEEWLTAQVRVVALEANEAVRSRSDRVGARSAPRHDS
jgi:transglutaminase-like putative cysteine protease